MSGYTHVEVRRQHQAGEATEATKGREHRLQRQDRRQLEPLSRGWKPSWARNTLTTQMQVQAGPRGRSDPPTPGVGSLAVSMRDDCQRNSKEQSEFDIFSAGLGRHSLVMHAVLACNRDIAICRMHTRLAYLAHHCTTHKPALFSITNRGASSELKDDQRLYRVRCCVRVTGSFDAGIAHVHSKHQALLLMYPALPCLSAHTGPAVSF